LAVLEASDQEHLMRQEQEDLGSGGGSGDQVEEEDLGSGGGSRDEVEDRDKEGQFGQDQDEYSDSLSAAVDEMIYHRLLDSLDVIRGERDRIREERNRNLEALTAIGGDLLDVIPETQEEYGRRRQGVLLEDGQILSDSEDDADGGTTSPREEDSRLDSGKGDVSSTGG